MLNYFHDRDTMYGTGKLKVLGVIMLQIEKCAATSVLTTSGGHLETLDIVLENHKYSKGLLPQNVVI
jgi:hypothetical protein